MKSYAVDSIYAGIIVMAVFLMVPFLMPYQGDDGPQGRAAKYTIGEEEKPEVFTRILDRVSSFYSMKRKKNNNFKNPSEIEKTEKGKLAAAKAAAAKKTDKSVENSAEDISSSSAPQGGVKSSNGAASRNQGLPGQVEYNGNFYNVHPDPYGNKYIITSDGPIPLETALAKGGRIVKPNYNYDATDGAEYRGYESNGGGYSKNSGRVRRDGRKVQDVDSYALSKAGGIKGFKHGKASSMDNGNSGGQERRMGESSGGFSGSYDFNSSKGYEDLKHSISSKASSGGNAKKEEEERSAQPKAYVLQDAMSVIGDNPLGVSETGNYIDDINVGGNIEESLGGWGDTSVPAAAENAANSKNISIAMSANYEQAKGIIPQNAKVRREMTKELLGKTSFIGNAGNDSSISDPWILPNNIDKGPGTSFYNENSDVLMSNSKIKASDWKESDIHYEKMSKEIEKKSAGKLIPVAIIDGQKDPYTMTSMPKDTFYYKTTAGLLNQKIVDVSDKGNIYLNKLDKNGVLIIVPEKQLADNLRRDGYKVSLFNNYIVTPNNLNSFSSDTSAAIGELAEAKKNDDKAKQESISTSLRELNLK